jgi:integrase
MRKKKGTITFRSVEVFKGPGRLHCGERGLGLYLEVTRSGSKLWVLRYLKPNTRRPTETSVGKYPILSLAGARTKAREMMRDIAMGRDPIEQKREAREQARQAATTFKSALDAYRTAPAYRDLAATATLTQRCERHASQLMAKQLTSIDTQMIAAALRHVHQSAPHTGRRTLAGIARILDWAKVNGLRTGDNPATFKGNFEFLWGKPKATTHLKCAAYDEVPAIYARLCELESTSAACLRFLILTGVRTSNALFTTWNEIDMSRRVWTIAPDRMKMKNRAAFVVPLTDEAMTILNSMRERWPDSDLVFPADRHGGKHHPRTLAYLIRRGLRVDATVHGFRSAMRDWLGDETNVERDVAEMCLAHLAKGVESAYRRSTALDKRRVALTLWAKHVTGNRDADVVVPFVGAAR